MKKKWFSLIAILLSTLILSHQAVASDIDNLLKSREKEVDIGIAALIFAKELYPDLDVGAYSRKIDLLVVKAKLFIKNNQDPEQRVRALNTFFYQIEGFSYDRAPNAENKKENRFLNGILDTKKGTCVNMPILYLAIAQRLGYPVYPVAAPDHLFLRYVDPRLKKQNIEVTAGGGYSPDEVYIKDFNISKKALKSGAYLRTMTYRQFLADLLGENAVNLAMSGSTDKAIRYFEKAIQINPKFPDYYEQLRVLYLMKSKQAGIETAGQLREKAKQCFIKTEELGLIRK